MRYLNSALAPPDSVLADLTFGYPQAHTAGWDFRIGPSRFGGDDYEAQQARFPS